MNKNFPLIILFYSISLSAPFSLSNWFSLWMTLEMNTLSFLTLYLFFFKSNKFSENAMTYFLIQAISSIILMSSFFNILCFSTFFDISILFFFSILLKLAVAPNHSWLIPLTLSSPWLLTFLLLTLQKIIPIIFLESSQMELNFLILLFSLISAVTGSMKNLISKSLKMLLILSSISNMSWILIGVMISSMLWKFFFLIYFFSLNFIFLSKEKNQNFNYSLMIFLNLLSIGGIPPMMGFFPKLNICAELLNLNLKFIFVLLFILSILDLFVYLRQTYFVNFSTPATLIWQHQMKKPLKTWMILNFIIFLMML
uniref:NADH-ubiquinone oxidoreductase chain 2 n=1 Tax=Thulinius sp. DVL-2010 TaxID=867920 RepID=F8RJC3_9BILA|nr:NADH dehydrogenase subunit 2 [Thulinius sp. DVL-2010]ADK97605.1 NADH dehydrogenase subunit 2 [Thulinius sp. DVL-2010]